MPDHNAAAEKAVFVQLERARVLDHTLYGVFCRRRIVRRAGIARGERRVGIFKIRQKDAHLRRERVHGIDRFISRRIPHDRDLRLCDGERFPYFRRELRAGDEIEVVHALRFQPGEDRREALDGDRFADPPAAERIVLAVHAAERTPGEEHRAAPPLAADAGLLAVVRRGARHAHGASHMAHARAYRAVCPALPGAETAVRHAAPRR